MTTVPTTYGSVTKFFHWTTAALILVLIPLGLIANRLPYETSEQLSQKAWVFSLHKTLGVAVFFVALARIIWALTQAKPGPLHPQRKAETFLAELVHWLLYGSLVLAPLTGWIGHAATTGFAPIWWPFGQSLPLVPKDQGIAESFASLHWTLTKVMAASIALHIAGALKHHFVDKDATLRRMWFGASTVPAVPHHRTPIAAPVAAAVIFGLASAGALAFTAPQVEREAATLANVTSDWVVNDGTLAITVLQLGSEVTGTFSDWTADITFDPDAGPIYGDVSTTIAIGSLTLGSVTDQAMGRDFFQATDFPTATFAGPITMDDGYQIVGTLTVKGVSAPVTLNFDLDLDGSTARMTGTAQIDRTTFNIGASMPDETNLGFGVTIAIDLTATMAE